MIIIVTERLLTLVPVLIGVTFVSFALLFVIPGDPILNFVGERAAPETIVELRTAWGLDKPLAVQYGTFLSKLARGDLGTSYRTHRLVFPQILSALQNTLQLALAALLVATTVGISLGLVAVLGGKWANRLVLTFTLLCLGIPVYLWALFLLYVFAIHWQLLPVGGQGSWQHLILPALSLGLRHGVILSRYVYQTLSQIITSPYIQVAQAKGLSFPRVVVKHGLRNALIPIVTVLGMDFASYLNGSVLTETIFGWPGLGRLAVDSLISRDFPMIQGIVLLSSVVFLLANLLIDLAYVMLDPRLRYR